MRITKHQCYTIQRAIGRTPVRVAHQWEVKRTFAAESPKGHQHN